MNESVKTWLKATFRKNAKGYTLIAGVFLAGIILSFLLNISVASKEEIKLYISDFISNVKSYSIDSVKTFCISMNSNIKSIVLLFTMSLCVLGSYAILVYIFVKGFSYGTFLCVLINALGIKTSLIFLCIVLLHMVVSAPCLMIYSLFSIKNSHAVKGGGNRNGYRVFFSLGCAVMCLAVLCISSLMQAYLEPFLIRLSGI